MNLLKGLYTFLAFFLAEPSGIGTGWGIKVNDKVEAKWLPPSDVQRTTDNVA